MSFSSVLKQSLPASSRVSHAPRNNFNRNLGQTSAPKVDNLYLPKNCGFSLPFDPSIPMDKYLCAVGDLVGDEKMVFAGKNNDIVKFYLTSEAEVMKLYENHPQVVIDSKPLIVKKLVDIGHKIFLCNVEPGVPDSMLINELSKYTKVVSQIKFVNLGSRNERFGHLIGFRRTVFVESIDDLPSSFGLYYDNTNYKIFVVIDKVKCFNCNAEGHLIKSCPVKNVSVQERLDPSTFESRGSYTRNDAIISAFLPSFESKTPTTAVSPLPNVSVSSKEAQIVPVSNSNVQCQNQSPDGGNIQSQEAPSQVPTATGSTEVIIENMPAPSPMETNQDICKKRAHTQSPPPTNGDKKPCVSSTKSDVLQCLVPVIEKCEPSIDASVFVDLVRDLKSSKRKLEIITDDYGMDLNVVISVLTNIITDESSSLDTKVINRLKNLRKALLTHTNSESKVVPPTSSITQSVPVNTDSMFSDSESDLSQI